MTPSPGGNAGGIAPELVWRRAARVGGGLCQGDELLVVAKHEAFARAAAARRCRPLHARSTSMHGATAADTHPAQAQGEIQGVLQRSIIPGYPGFALTLCVR